MKLLALILATAACALPANAEDTPLWKKMNDEELKAFAETIVQGIQISPEVAFGRSGDTGNPRLRVRTYPHGDQGLLVVESSVAKNGNVEKELIQGVQLKRVKDDGSIETLWEVLRGEPAPAPAHLRAPKVQWIIEQKASEAPSRNGPTDFPAGKLFRSAG